MGKLTAAAAGIFLGASVAISTAWAAPPAQAPAWAFAINSPLTRAGTDGDPASIRRVPGSSAGFTAAQVRNGFSVPDWFPDAHPPMPPVVGAGHRPTVMACGFCHLPNGQGRPENAPLAGLPAAYIAQQIADFRKGDRLAAAVTGPIASMVGIARNVDAADITAAADYFSRLSYQPWIRVIAARRVPRTRVVGWMYQPIPNAGTEPLGRRILEVPADVGRTELRDSSSGFIAYVPVGSLRRGARLVLTGDDGHTIRCSICHGPSLAGLGGVPPIAGRSPSYLMRQLYDLKNGARKGVDTELMREPLAHLTYEDMLCIVAYVASLPP